MNFSWAIPLLLLVAVSVGGALLPSVPALKPGGPINPGDTAWMLTASGLVMLMTPGLAFFYGGMVRVQNVISTMFQSFVALGVISIFWVVCGFSLAFGESVNGLIGNPTTYFMLQGIGNATHPDLAPTIPLSLFVLFQLKFAIITPALITGAFAERIRFSSYLLFMVLFSIFIYCPLAHWTWHPQGFLRQWGVLDFAGGTVVHMSAGVSALAGALFLGKRKLNSLNQSESPAHIPFILLGTGMLWFGWFGFNAGSALAANDLAATAFLNTNSASAAAMLAWMFFDALKGKKISAVGACIGAVVGLVAITPGAGYVSLGAAIFIGTATSLISNQLVDWKHKFKYDDTLDVFACHGIGGILGMIFTGVFAKDVGLVYGKTETFTHHLWAFVLVSVFCFVGAYLLYFITGLIVPMRVTEEQEHAGLDLSQHGEQFS